MLDTLRKGMAEMTQEISKAKEKKMELPGGPLIQLSRTIEGRRTLSTIRELSAQIIVQRGNSASRPLERPGTDGGRFWFRFYGPLEQALCG
jgi:hypothetical protein